MRMCKSNDKMIVPGLCDEVWLAQHTHKKNNPQGNKTDKKSVWQRSFKNYAAAKNKNRDGRWKTSTLEKCLSDTKKSRLWMSAKVCLMNLHCNDTALLSCSWCKKWRKKKDLDLIKHQHSLTLTYTHMHAHAHPQKERNLKSDDGRVSGLI